MRKKSLAHRYCARVYLSIDVNKILELFTGSPENGTKSDHSLMGLQAISKYFVRSWLAPPSGYFSQIDALVSLYLSNNGNVLKLGCWLKADYANLTSRRIMHEKAMSIRRLIRFRRKWKIKLTRQKLSDQEAAIGFQVRRERVLKGRILLEILIC